MQIKKVRRLYPMHGRTDDEKRELVVSNWFKFKSDRLKCAVLLQSIPEELYAEVISMLMWRTNLCDASRQARVVLYLAYVTDKVNQTSTVTNMARDLGTLYTKAYYDLKMFGLVPFWTIANMLISEGIALHWDINGIAALEGSVCNDLAETDW